MMKNYQVESDRYNELLAKEERLKLLENAIRITASYSDISQLKTIFGLNDEEAAKI